jgi:hypothetical protein
MVRHHIAQGAGLFLEPRTVFDAHRFSRGTLPSFSTGLRDTPYTVLPGRAAYVFSTAAPDNPWAPVTMTVRWVFDSMRWTVILLSFER